MCPSGYPTPGAHTYPVSGNDICTVDGSTKTLTCTLEHSVQGSDIWVVEDYDTDTLEVYEIWGTVYEVSGSVTLIKDFCFDIDAKSACSVDGSSCYIEKVVVYGSLQADNINFGYTEGSTMYSLQPTSLTPHLSAYAYGGDDRDDIQGSGHAGTSPPYAEYLCGQGEVDTIDGHPGDDFLYGGACDDLLAASVPSGTDSGQLDGADVLLGGYGDDYIYGDEADDLIQGGHGVDTIDGETGNDVLLGGAGDDYLLGGDGSDKMNGGPGSDWLDGGAHADVICGGPDADELLDSGTSGLDAFWGAESLDVVTCSTGDTVDSLSGGATTGCSIATTMPACP